MENNLDFLFKPSGVALIGASPNPLKWGNWMAKRLIECGYTGGIYLVANKGGRIHGRETWKKVTDIEYPIDLAIIGIPANTVLEAIKECVEKGVKGVIIVTAGFGETGEDGKKLEREILQLAGSGGLRLVGPNCLGIYNAEVSLNTSPLDLQSGFISFLTQSGNFAMDVNYHAREKKLGYSKWASIGNQIDIRFNEYLDYIDKDPETRVILLYIESLFIDSTQDGRNFLEIAKKITEKRPIVALKIGATPAGARSASSHTGALAGRDEVFEGAFKQAGIIRVINSSELIDVGEALGKCYLPRGNRIAILTDGGGHGTIASDAAERNGLSIPILSKNVQDKLKEILPSQAAIKNPVDFAGGAEADLWNFIRCSDALLKDEDIDGLVVVGQYGGYGIDLAEEFYALEEKVSTAFTELIRSYKKPIIFHTMYQSSKVKSLAILSQGGIPVYPTVETAMLCMGALVKYRKYINRSKDMSNDISESLQSDRVFRARQITKQIKNEGRRVALENEAREILKAYNLPGGNYKIGKNKYEAAVVSEEIGFPVAMKILSPDVIHKSDVGGVRLNLENKEEVGNAFDQIVGEVKLHEPSAEICGVIVTPMERRGVEVIIGMVADQTFGPTVMFGMGGVFVEILKDVSFRIAPLKSADAYEMIEEVKAFPILKGFRGKNPANIDALATIIMKLSILATEIPEIRELDMNPIFASETGASIADARVLLQ